MSTRHLWSNAARLALVAASLVPLVGCGSEMLRTGRAPVFLAVVGMEASAGGDGQVSAFLLSDVRTMVDSTVNGQTVKVPTIVNDTATATIRVEAKNQSVPTTAINAVTLTRYRVAFRRTDGRNTPGVDVPYGFDGGLGVTIPAGQEGDVTIELVRHQAKLEPPLSSLAGQGGLGFISTIAEIMFFGHDQNGNEVTVTARMDVQFGDFADE